MTVTEWAQEYSPDVQYELLYDKLWSNVTFVHEIELMVHRVCDKFTTQPNAVVLEVIGEHVNQSILCKGLVLPIVELRVDNIGLRIIFSGTSVHTWCCTVFSKIEIAVDMSDVFTTKRPDCLPEGGRGDCGLWKHLPEHLCKGYLSDNPCEFSFSVTNDYEFYAALRRIVQFLNFVHKSSPADVDI